MKQRGEMQSDFDIDPQPYTAVWYLMMRDLPRRAFHGSYHINERVPPAPQSTTEILRIELGIHHRDQASMSKERKKTIENAIKQSVRALSDLEINAIMEFIDDHCEICNLHLAVGTLSNSIPMRTCHACKAKHDSVQRS